MFSSFVIMSVFAVARCSVSCSASFLSFRFLLEIPKKIANATEIPLNNNESSIVTRLLLSERSHVVGVAVSPHVVLKDIQFPVCLIDHIPEFLFDLLLHF
ncbi:hypothetical protein 2019_scaffold132_00060 [Bacteriophage sp.]|nr:hypothetical protein 2019_scaffold132_00060 [Bacteriophage sp.]